MTINKTPCAAFLQCVVLGESLDCGEGRRSLLISKRVVAWATLATSELSWQSRVESRAWWSQDLKR